MTSETFLAGSVVAAFLAGAIALFAPCCISVMLPAYLAGAFSNRRRLVAATFLFSAGVATIVVPIALGAMAVRRLLTQQHTAVYVGAGLVMLALAAYTLAGGTFRLPTPSGRRGAGAGPAAIYTLGVFSGMTSSCCAPVLAGVVALSAAASSLAVASGLAAAYVFGMVGPLFVISLLWDRFDWTSTRLFRPRRFTWRLGPVRRTVAATNLAGGVLLTVIGAATVWVGLAGQAMPAPGGRLAGLFAWLQHVARRGADAVSWIPNWLVAVALLLTLAWLARRALRPAGAPASESDSCHTQEDVDERQHA